MVVFTIILSYRDIMTASIVISHEHIRDRFSKKETYYAREKRLTRKKKIFRWVLEHRMRYLYNIILYIDIIYYTLFKLKRVVNGRTVSRGVEILVYYKACILSARLGKIKL